MAIPSYARSVFIALSLAVAWPAAASPESLAQEVAALDETPLDRAAFQALLTRVRESNDPALLAQAWMGRCHNLIGSDPAQAREAAEAGIPVATEADAHEALGGLLACRGYLRQVDGELDAAFADFDAAVAASVLAGDRPGAAQARVLRGEVQYERGNFADAQVDLQAAYREYVELGDVVQQSYSLNAIANLYADPRVGQYAQALDYYRQLLAAHEAAGRKRDAANSHFNIASTLLSTQDFDQAEASFRAALAGFEAAGDGESVIETQAAMASLYNRMDRPADALPLADLAIARARTQGRPATLAAAQLTRGSALRRLGRLDEAAIELGAAHRYYQQHNNTRYLERIADESAELAAGANRWQDAYLARSEQLQLGRRLRQQLDDELSSRLRVQFDTERQEDENAALARESGLRAAALRDGERIRRLQALVIALAAVLVIGLAWRARRNALQSRAMRTLALTDELTGLANRRAILQALQSRLDAPDRAPVPVLMLDIDHFKSINDRLGHDAGDRVLRRVASTVRDALGNQGELGRIGGEEFLVLLVPEAAHRLAEVAERLRIAVEQDPSDPPLRISLGGGLANDGERRSEDLLKRVDLALYRAKESGRNRVEISPAP